MSCNCFCKCSVLQNDVASSDLEQQLVFGESLDWFQQVGVQAQFVLQLFLTLLHSGKRGFESCVSQISV